MSDQYQIESSFRLWYKPLCLYALHYLGSIDESEDVVQDVLSAVSDAFDIRLRFR